MKIELSEVTVRDIVEGFVDNAEEGIVGYGGKLNIRPKYQREFIYNTKERNAVMDTIIKQFPLNTMYWVKNSDETFELLDGQQRTISFCHYIDNRFSINHRAFSNLTNGEQKAILDYKVLVYICEGDDREKLDWFRTINIAGKKLTRQELRNITYTGAWLTSAKRTFSKTGCAAYLLSRGYVRGVAIRQEILELVLDWISGGEIEAYMSANQNEPNANELWLYFMNVIEWAKLTFPIYRREMRGVNWGELYDSYHTKKYDVSLLDGEVKALMIDDDVTRKRGIYPYVLTREIRYLNVRAFSAGQRRAAYERQGGICPSKECAGERKRFDFSEMEADHITPWHEGGRTTAENCQMLCKECNRRKAGK